MAASRSPSRAEQSKKSTPERKSRMPVNPALGSSVSTLELQSALDNPVASRPEAILRLQRLSGNRAVSGLIQRKEVVGAAHDHFEQEADRVAKQVMSASAGSVQRMEEEEEELQAQSISGQDSFAPGADFESRLNSRHGGGQPLPGDTRAFMENRFGADFSGVRVHTDSASVQLNRDVQAQAFTHGNDIFMGEGKYNPHSETGKELLAHELTHTIQQGASSVQHWSLTSSIPTIQASSLVNSSVVQRKEVFIHSLAHTRIVAVDRAKPPAKQAKQVEDSPKARPLKKLDVIEVDDDGSPNHVVDDAGKAIWLRVKGTPKEYVRAEKTYDLGYKPTKGGVEGLGQVKDKMAAVEGRAKAPESKGEDVAEIAGGALEAAGGGIDDAIAEESEESGMVSSSVQDHEAAGASGVIGAVGGLLGLSMGIISLAKGGGTLEEKLDAIFDVLSGASDTAGGVAKAVSEFQGGGDELAATKASGWIDSVGSVFSSIKSGFATIRNLVQIIQMAMEDEEKAASEYFAQVGRIIKSALDTASSVASSVKTFWEAVEGAAPVVFGQLIPGLDIAISGVQIIMKGYYLIVSAHQWKQMQKVREKMDVDLHGANPVKADKETFTAVRDFYKEKEASIANNEAYVAEKQKQIDELVKERDRATTSAKRKNELQVIITRKEGKRDAARRQIGQAKKDIASKGTDTATNPKGVTQEALAESDLVDELKDANSKRVVRQSVHILAEAAKIAGSITTLSGVAAPAGVALKASAAGLDLSLPLFRALKQYGRGVAARNLAKGESGIANKIFDPSKATPAKLEARKKHALRILKLAAALPVPTLQPGDPGYDAQKAVFDKKGAQIEGYIEATGCPPKKLYTLNGNPLAQIKLLATGMAKREFAE